MKKKAPILIGSCLLIFAFANFVHSQTLEKEQVLFCGSMPVMFLGAEESTRGATTMVMAIRADYSPAGSGTAILVRSDVLADGETEDDLRAVFTDNKKFVEYLQKEVFFEIPFFGSHPDAKPRRRERSEDANQSSEGRRRRESPMPVYEAKITRSGDGVTRVTEQIKAEKMDVELTWSDLGTPMVLATPPRGVGPPFNISGVIVPAKSVRVLINGVEAKGGLQKGPVESGISFPPAFVMASTTWVKPPGPVPPKRRSRSSGESGGREEGR